MKALTKSISILNLFLIDEGELSLDAIARQANMNKSTARRITLALVECGFLQQAKKGGTYSLGMRFLDFGQAVKRRNPILEIAGPHMAELGRKTDETVSLAVWDGKRAVIPQSFLPSQPLKVISHEGTMTWLHQSSLGKAMMADMSDRELESLLSTGLQRFTPNTLTDADELKKHLMAIRREGVAIDDEEGILGVRGIAAAFKNREGVLQGAITLLGPSVRLTREKIREYIPLVKNSAAQISSALGYAGAATGNLPSS